MPTSQIDESGLITIRSADEAWALLGFVLSDGVLPENINLVFDGWPQFDMKVDGRDWKCTVPTRVMAPLLDVQRDLHRAYATVCYGSPNLRKLSDEDRDLLELVVKVDKGSSDLKAPTWTQLNELAKKAIEKMNSRDVVITVLGIAVVIGSVEISKAWIAERQAAVDSEKTVQLSKEETKRLEVFAQAVKQQPSLAETRSDHEATQNKLLKAVKPGDKVVSKGVELHSDQVMAITQTDRAHSEDIDISGRFRVIANDTSKSAGFRIKVVRVSDNLTFNAEVPIELESEKQKLIQRAEWSKGAILVELNITASLLRDSITNAVVYGAEEVPSTQN